MKPTIALRAATALAVLAAMPAYAQKNVGSRSAPSAAAQTAAIPGVRYKAGDVVIQDAGDMVGVYLDQKNSAYSAANPIIVSRRQGVVFFNGQLYSARDAEGQQALAVAEQLAGLYRAAVGRRDRMRSWEISQGGDIVQESLSTGAGGSDVLQRGAESLFGLYQRGTSVGRERAAIEAQRGHYALYAAISGARTIASMQQSNARRQQELRENAQTRVSEVCTRAHRLAGRGPVYAQRAREIAPECFPRPRR